MICHEHNLAAKATGTSAINARFGIRVGLRTTDPFRNLVGDEWRKEHWYATARERDAALADMSQRYVYFRPGDQPTLKFEKIER